MNLDILRERLQALKERATPTQVRALVDIAMQAILLADDAREASEESWDGDALRVAGDRADAMWEILESFYRLVGGDEGEA